MRKDDEFILHEETPGIKGEGKGRRAAGPPGGGREFGMQGTRGSKELGGDRCPTQEGEMALQQ